MPLLSGREIRDVPQRNSRCSVTKRKNVTESLGLDFALRLPKLELKHGFQMNAL